MRPMSCAFNIQRVQSKRGDLIRLRNSNIFQKNLYISKKMYISKIIIIVIIIKITWLLIKLFLLDAGWIWSPHPVQYFVNAWLLFPQRVHTVFCIFLFSGW